MSLKKYNEKRDFNKTAEPKSGKPKPSGKLQFVIQKHDAPRLHYDFRLEQEGVLKSWAVPKGPSTDPKTKRLAMMVEDHPFDYKDFEGIIPKDEYGGGTVITWNEGTYEPIEKIKGKKKQEKHLSAQLQSGSVGTSFNHKDQKDMIAQFRPLIIDKSPFSDVPDVNKPSRFKPNPPKAKATWLKPELVFEVAFSEVTTDGVFRHPSFQGMRIDKKSKEVIRETEIETKAIVEHKSAEESDTRPVSTDRHAGAIAPPKPGGRKTLLNPKDETQVRKVGGRELKFTHLS